MRYQAVLIIAIVTWSATVTASDDLTLAEKAAIFNTDIIERFLHNGQLATRRRLPTPERPYVTHNMSDNAYMTGIYCAMQTWRYLATDDPDAAQQARAAFQALNHLARVSGRPGLLARASVPDGAPWFDDGIWRDSTDGLHRWRGNVSSDQVDGLMLGAYVYFAHLADAAERLLLAETVVQIVGAILDDGLRIVGYDGNVTTWGHYEPEYVTNDEPMNALLLLQMVKIANAVTGDERFETEYRRLVELGYPRIGETARLDRAPLSANHSDDVLIALALYPLLELEHDPDIRRSYREAARRWFHGGVHPGVSVEANPFASFLWHHWTGDGAYDSAGIQTLDDMPLSMKWNTDTITSYAARFGFRYQVEPVPVPVPATGEGPLPVSQRGRTWSILVHNPYTVGGDRWTSAPFETNGLDYLVSYWFGRAHGMIGAVD